MVTLAILDAFLDLDVAFLALFVRAALAVAALAAGHAVERGVVLRQFARAEEFAQLRGSREREEGEDQEGAGAHGGMLYTFQALKKSKL